MPEGIYHERIFRLFPLLRVCHLLFGNYRHYTLDNLFVAPSYDEFFVPIRSTLLNLQSLTLRFCFSRFLSHLFEHLPLLEELNCYLFDLFGKPQPDLIERYNK